MTPGGRQPYVSNRGPLEVSYKGKEGPIKPATVPKVKAPLEEGCCG